MAPRMDLYNNLLPARAISPIADSSDNTVLTSEVLDAQGFETVLLLILIGNLADGAATWTVLIEESATDFSGSDVADVNLEVSESNVSFDQADDNSVRRIEIRPTLRYVRATITPADNGAEAFVCACWLKGNARHKPVTAQAT